jgi:hypothetical protein
VAASPSRFTADAASHRLIGCVESDSRLPAAGKRMGFAGGRDSAPERRPVARHAKVEALPS